MTTPKTKNKTTKPEVKKQTKHYIDIADIIETLANAHESIEDHDDVINNHYEVLQEIQENQDTLFSNDEIIADKLNGIFWMCLIGVGVAITFAFIALFR
jgi:hypothetical protein